MMAILELTIKLSLIILLALGATALLRRRSAALRHWILSVAFVSAAATPLITLVVPSWQAPAAARWPVSRFEPAADADARLEARPVVVQRPIQRPLEPPPADAPPRLSVAAAIAAVWMLGAALGLGHLIIGFVRLRRRAARAQRVPDGPLLALVRQISDALGVPRPVVVLQSDEPSLLVTWGCAPSKIMLPAAARDWSADRLRVVLAHELAHVQRRDWIVQIVAEVLRSICWFNPLIRIACRRLRRESEHACDDAVLNLGVAGPDYATHLLALARALGKSHRPWRPALAMAHTDSLERRITAMLNAHLNRRPITRPARVAATIVMVSLTLAIGAFQVAAQALSTFTGSVFDSTGRVVPGAILVLVDEQTGTPRETRSDQTGRFEFAELPAGSYVFENLTAGFRKPIGKVKLAGQHLQQDVTLQVGALQEEITITGTPGAPPDPPRASTQRAYQKRDATGCVAGTIGGNIRTPHKVRDVRPIYPQALQDAGVEGTVVLDAVIGSDGDVREVNVIGDPHPGLASAATDAVRLWQFDWTLLNCVPIEVSMTVTANFSLVR